MDVTYTQAALADIIAAALAESYVAAEQAARDANAAVYPWQRQQARERLQAAAVASRTLTALEERLGWSEDAIEAVAAAAVERHRHATQTLS